jgi:antitoxin HigA-1
MPSKSASRIITRESDWLGPAIPPGEILLEEYLKPLGVGQVKAAQALGISLNRLNEIVLGKRGITADTALRLARYLKTSPQLWMRLQADWELHHAMRRERRKAS